MKRNYPLLLVSQFITAFGDNAILAVILGQFLFRRQQGLITETDFGAANAFYTSVLFVPYVLLAPFAGHFGDRYPKTTILWLGNGMKLVGTLLAAASLVGGDTFQAAGYFLVGAGACIYSPAKYGILSEILPREALVKANGTVEMLTLVAILTGTIAGAKAIDHLSVPACYALLVAQYGLSLLLNLAMKPTPPQSRILLADSLGEFRRHFGRLFGSRRLALVMGGTAIFWICGATMKMNFSPWGEGVLGLETNTQIAMLGLWLSVGIMLGSVAAGRVHKVSDLSGARRYGLVMAGFILLLSAVSSYAPAVTLLVLAGAAGGLFLIPLNAALQAETDIDKVGKSIALQNFVENVAMLGGGALVFSAVHLGAGPKQVFLLLAILVAAAASFLVFPPPEPRAEQEVPSC